MSDFELFRPGEGSESYDPAAFERFKEQMKKNAAFMAAARWQEQKQKEKEDKLAKILLKFIQTNQKSGILMLAAKLLEQNIPPSVILAIILLGNEEVQAELKKEISAEMKQIEGPLSSQPPPSDTPAFALVPKFEDQSIPLKVKAEIDDWGKGIFDACSAVPFRVLETVLDKEGNIKKIVVDCCANILDDYLASNGIPQILYDSCFSFCEFMIRGVLQALKKQIENQKELR